MKPLRIVAATGGRHYDDEATVNATFDALHAEEPIDVIVHGGATGADELVNAWAIRNNVQTAVFRVPSATWTFLGRKAGPRRNRLMLTTTAPGLLVSFPGGPGTADCTAMGRILGIKVIEVR